jgi:hypothetical protein
MLLAAPHSRPILQHAGFPPTTNHEVKKLPRDSGRHFAAAVLLFVAAGQSWSRGGDVLTAAGFAILRTHDRVTAIAAWRLAFRVHDYVFDIFWLPDLPLVPDAATVPLRKALRV